MYSLIQITCVKLFGLDMKFFIFNFDTNVFGLLIWNSLVRPQVRDLGLTSGPMLWADLLDQIFGPQSLWHRPAQKNYELDRYRCDVLPGWKLFYFTRNYLRLQWCWWLQVSDNFSCWWQNFDLGDIDVTVTL